MDQSSYFSCDAMTESNEGTFQVFKGEGGNQQANGKHQAEAERFVANVGQGVEHNSVKQIEGVAYFPEPQKSGREFSASQGEQCDEE